MNSPGPDAAVPAGRSAKPRRRIWGLLFGLLAALAVGVALLAIFAGMALVAVLAIWFAPTIGWVAALLWVARSPRTS